MPWEAIVAGVLAAIGGVVWLVRLEGRVNHVEAKVDELKVRHESLDSKIVERLSAIEKMMSRMEGYLKAKFNMEE